MFRPCTNPGPKKKKVGILTYNGSGYEAIKVLLDDLGELLLEPVELLLKTLGVPLIAVVAGGAPRSKRVTPRECGCPMSSFLDGVRSSASPKRAAT